MALPKLPGEGPSGNKAILPKQDNPITTLKLIKGNLQVNMANGESHDLGNLRGEPGPSGKDGNSIEGARGYTGVTGDEGKQGDIGEKGEVGPQGNDGPSGDKGEDGDIGLTGPQGGVGPTGETGPTGPGGEKGDIGPRGFSGATVIGPTGRDGAKGEPGPEGQAVDGKDGSIPDHEIDLPGGRFRFRKPSGEWGQWIRIPRGGLGGQDWTQSKLNLRTSGWIELGPGPNGSIGNFRFIIVGGLLEIQKSTAAGWASHTYHAKWGI